MTETITFLIGFIIGYGIASLLLARKRFIVNIDKETGNISVEPVKRPKQKMEFIGEPTAQEVEEAERPGVLQNFLGTFRKPAKKEEEEEEV